LGGFKLIDDSEKDNSNKNINPASHDGQDNNADDHQKDHDSQISNYKKSDNKNPEKASENGKPSEGKVSGNSNGSSKESSNINNSEDRIKNDDHAYHFPMNLEHNLINSVKANRDKIIKGVAIVLGGFLILYGLIFISVSVTKVASNVIFGEDATADAFLILLGIFIIVAAFAQTIMEKTPLSKIGTELDDKEEAESDDNSEKVKEVNDNKIDNDNKDNIVKENKR
jgi:hypothetical protein